MINSRTLKAVAGFLDMARTKCVAGGLRHPWHHEVRRRQGRMNVRRDDFAMLGASNGTWPVKAWYNVPARLYISDKKSSSLPFDLLGSNIIRRAPNGLFLEMISLGFPGEAEIDLLRSPSALKRILPV